MSRLDDLDCFLWHKVLKYCGNKERLSLRGVNKSLNEAIKISHTVTIRRFDRAFDPDDKALSIGIIEKLCLMNASYGNAQFVLSKSNFQADIISILENRTRYRGLFRSGGTIIDHPIFWSHENVRNVRKLSLTIENMDTTGNFINHLSNESVKYKRLESLYLNINTLETGRMMILFGKGCFPKLKKLVIVGFKGELSDEDKKVVDQLNLNYFSLNDKCLIGKEKGRKNLKEKIGRNFDGKRVLIKHAKEKEMQLFDVIMAAIIYNILLVSISLVLYIGYEGVAIGMTFLSWCLSFF